MNLEEKPWRHDTLKKPKPVKKEPEKKKEGIYCELCGERADIVGDVRDTAGRFSRLQRVRCRECKEEMLMEIK